MSLGQFYSFQPIQFMDGLLNPIIGVGRLPSALIDRTTGTNIGNMTGSSGLAAAFDGVTNQAQAASAANTSGPGYIGKTMAVPTAIESVTCYGTNNAGYINNSDPTVTIDLYGKNDVTPSGPTDGTLLGTVVFTDTANESANPRLINSSDQNTYWDHVWVYIQSVAANSRIAEVQMTGWIT